MSALYFWRESYFRQLNVYYAGKCHFKTATQDLLEGFKVKADPSPGLFLAGFVGPT